MSCRFILPFWYNSYFQPPVLFFIQSLAMTSYKYTAEFDPAVNSPAKIEPYEVPIMSNLSAAPHFKWVLGAFLPLEIGLWRLVVFHIIYMFPFLFTYSYIRVNTEYRGGKQSFNKLFCCRTAYCRQCATSPLRIPTSWTQGRLHLPEYNTMVHTADHMLSLLPIPSS
jgi:hypothetical protein